MTKIVITFAADEKFRNAILGSLDPVGNVVFLSDIREKERSLELANADVLMSWLLGRELKTSELAKISNVRLLQLLSAGADHLPFSQIPPTVTIASNAGAYAEQMAEHAIAMILAISKNLLDRHNKLVKGVFDQKNMNRMLSGSTCAILGFGGIGKAVARRLRCLGVKILAINTTGKTDESVEFVGTLKDLEYVFRLADVVIVSIPLTKFTRHLIGKRELGWMKNDATLVNVARGDIINEAALFEKLKTHSTFNAAIDTWWVEPLLRGNFRTHYPFLKLPNVLGSPHNSALISDSMTAAAVHAAENVKRFLNNEHVLGVVKRSDYI
jgi:glycerate dehydrogenase